MTRIKLIVTFGILLVASRLVPAQCPAVGRDTTCGTILTITQTGATVAFTGQPPFDGIEDTLVGVRNNSNLPVRALGLRSAATIFGFDGDGLTTYGVPGNALDSTGYGGPNAYFRDISPDRRSGTINFIIPIPPGGTAYFALEESIGSATPCSAIINNAVAIPTLSDGDRSLSGEPTAINSSFTPNLGYTLAQAANLCGFADFDWIQKMTHLADPSPYYARNPVNPTTRIHLTSASTPFYDPPPNGWSYEPAAWASLPFYWSPTLNGTEISLDQKKLPLGPLYTTLTFRDVPVNPCLPESNGLPSKNWLISAENRADCENRIAPIGSYTGFKTHLAGINFDGSGVDLGIGFTWKSTFNGTSGGVAKTRNPQSADLGSGEGGITVTAIEPITNYEYNGVAVINVNGNPVGTSADLAISNTDGISTTPTGSTLTYTIVAANNGPDGVTGAAVSDAFPAAFTSTTWLCAGSGGGACGTANGTGDINQLVNLPSGASVTYTVVANLNRTTTGNLTNTATITAPVSVTDPNSGNNSATDVDIVTTPSVFVIDDVSKPEGDSGTSSFVFTVSKIGSTGFSTIVQFETRDGSATVADNDYQPVTGTLSFGPLETTKTITVLVNGDTRVEPNETFTVHLAFNPVNGVIGDADGTGMIVNDDFPTPTPIPTPTPTPTTANRFEGDINRTVLGVPGIGDGDITVGDQVQYQRFLSGADCPSAHEQPRLDAGSRATLGDGLFGSTDGAAIDAYARHDASTDSDPNTPGWQPTPVGGPTAITNLGCTPSADPEGETAATATETEAVSAARVVRVVSRSGRPGADITVDIEMNAQGNEAGTQFGLHFDPTALRISDVSGVNSNPDVMLGTGAPAGTTLNVNGADAANGNIGIGENFSGAGIAALPEGATRIARVRFHILDGAEIGTSRVAFDESVIRGFTSDVNGMSLAANYEGGDVSVTTSRGVTVSGRVTSSDGRGIRNATVTIINGDGMARTVTTSSFGYYTFDDVQAATYAIAVSSRQYRYASRTVDVSDNLSDIDFTGLE